MGGWIGQDMVVNGEWVTIWKATILICLQIQPRCQSAEGLEGGGEQKEKHLTHYSQQHSLQAGRYLSSRIETLRVRTTITLIKHTFLKETTPGFLPETINAKSYPQKPFFLNSF